MTAAKNLIIRELSEEANAALSWYKKKYSENANTKAAEKMISNYPELFDDRNRLKRELDEALRTIQEVKNIYRRIHLAEYDLMNMIGDGSDTDYPELSLLDEEE